MSKICYVLGAGFSAYAGLPVMANFIDKAKDIYFSDQEYDYKVEIKRTLESIREYAIIKEYMDCDLSNIEELLSIADMKTFTSKRKSNRDIKSFIKGVISFYENQLLKESKINRNLSSFVFTNNRRVDSYARFICSLFRIKTNCSTVIHADDGTTTKDISITSIDGNEYSIISFNYDTILEKILSMINSRCINGLLAFGRDNNSSIVRYCKLHGSIDTNTIVPPTWAKTLQSDIKQDWVDAYELLKKANSIRIIGFSFPNTDSHISYLLKSALIDNENLKNIDVICKDNQQSEVSKKYHSIFSTPKLSFINNGVEDLFDNINIRGDENYAIYDQLENAHRKLFPNSMF